MRKKIFFKLWMSSLQGKRQGKKHSVRICKQPQEKLQSYRKLREKKIVQEARIAVEDMNEVLSSISKSTSGSSSSWILDSGVLSCVIT